MSGATAETRVRRTAGQEVAHHVRSQITAKLEELTFLRADFVVIEADEVKRAASVAVTLVQLDVAAEDAGRDHLCTRAVDPHAALLEGVVGPIEVTLLIHVLPAKGSG